MFKNLTGKKMATLGLYIMLFAGIAGAIGAYLWNKGSRKANSEKHSELVDQGKGIKDGVDSIKSEITNHRKILINPSEIIIPAHTSFERPVVITNNYSYPVFMVIVQIDVIEGSLNLDSNFVMLPFGFATLMQKQSQVLQLDQINPNTSVTFTAKVSANNISQNSKIRIKIPKYSKSPIPDFRQDNQKDLPDSIKLPEGFVPKMEDNE